jgi:hypothetical protein
LVLANGLACLLIEGMDKAIAVYEEEGLRAAGAPTPDDEGKPWRS